MDVKRISKAIQNDPVKSRPEISDMAETDPSSTLRPDNGRVRRSKRRGENDVFNITGRSARGTTAAKFENTINISIRDRRFVFKNAQRAK